MADSPDTPETPGPPAGRPRDHAPSPARSWVLNPKYERVVRWLIILGGLAWLADGVGALRQEAWLASALRFGIGIGLIVFGPTFWARTARQSVDQPGSKKQEHRKAWLLAHPVVGSVVAGTVWGLMCGVLGGLLSGEWLVSMAFWLSAGLVLFGPLFVRGIRRLN